jgi:hypothetical protein
MEINVYLVHLFLLWMLNKNEGQNLFEKNILLRLNTSVVCVLCLGDAPSKPNCIYVRKDLEPAAPAMQQLDRCSVQEASGVERVDTQGTGGTPKR